MIKSIKIGTRSSKLALHQSNLVKDKLLGSSPSLKISLVEIKTKGDKIQDRNLNRNIDKGFFVKEIQEHLLDDQIDIAVHSLKDLPVENYSDDISSVILKRANHSDVFLSRDKKKLLDFDHSLRIGTSSLRRKAQLLNINTALKIDDIRGNVDTRISKMLDGEYDGLVMAAAGLERLGLEDYITEYFDTDQMLPAPGQGAISVEFKKKNNELFDILKNINDNETDLCTYYERSFMNELGGGCNSPIGAYSFISDKKKIITGSILSLDGSQVYKHSLEEDISNDVNIGKLLAEKLINSGANKIIKNLNIE
jgi:hydroxymethylbilane synthase|tara:strand:- start:5820 stop:6746 length:927 start_codon:yes stop_codon:yes gene_type:complete